MPASIEDALSPTEQATVLAHELVHHHRRDLWVNWFQVLLAAAFWFNPLVWMLNRALRQVREECCDDVLLHHRLTSRDGYCQTLVNAATQATLPVALGFAHGRLHPLGRRISRIMDQRRSLAPKVSLGGKVLLILAAAALWPGVRIDADDPVERRGDTTTSRAVRQDSALRMYMQRLQEEHIQARVDTLVRKTRLDQIMVLDNDELINSFDYIVPNTPMRRNRKKLLDIDLSIERAQQKYSREHPEVKRLMASRDLMQAKLSDAVEGLKKGLQVDYEVEKERCEGLGAILAEIRSNVDPATRRPEEEPGRGAAVKGDPPPLGSSSDLGAGSAEWERLQRAGNRARVDMLVRKTRLDQVMTMEDEVLMHAIDYIAPDNTLRSIKEALIDTELSLGLMQQQRGQEHPDVKRLVQGRDELRRTLSEALRGVKRGLQADYEVAKRTYEELDKLTAETRAR